MEVFPLKICLKPWAGPIPSRVDPQLANEGIPGASPQIFEKPHIKRSINNLLEEVNSWEPFLSWERSKGPNRAQPIIPIPFWASQPILGFFPSRNFAPRPIMQTIWKLKLANHQLRKLIGRNSQINPFPFLQIGQ